MGRGSVGGWEGIHHCQYDCQWYCFCQYDCNPLPVWLWSIASMIAIAIIANLQRGRGSVKGWEGGNSWALTRPTCVITVIIIIIIVIFVIIIIVIIVIIVIMVPPVIIVIVILVIGTIVIIVIIIIIVIIVIIVSSFSLIVMMMMLPAWAVLRAVTPEGRGKTSPKS